MHQKNLRSVDLNLLVILAALLEEASVSRAAARLHLSQPAVSHALERLRHVLGDPLLERRGQGMQPTPRALALWPELESWMALSGRLVSPPSAPLSALRQTVRLALADYPCALLLPPLMAELRTHAPGISVVCHNWNEGRNEIERVERGETDLVLSVLDDPPAGIERLFLGVDGTVGVCRAGHPLGARPSLARFCSFPQIIVSAVGAERTEVDDWLSEQGVTRQVALTVASFLAVPSLVEQTDAIALVPHSLAVHWAPAAALQRFVPPFPPPYFDIHLAWHERASEDRAVAFVRDTLAQVARQNLLQSAPGHRRATGTPARTTAGGRGLRRARKVTA